MHPFAGISFVVELPILWIGASPSILSFVDRFSAGLDIASELRQLLSKI
jgi:hypothetical protein